MNLSNNTYVIGLFLLISGVVFILSFVFLTLMFSTRKPAWGPLNDVSYIVALLLISPFIIASYSIGQPYNFALALIATALSITGLLLITITQLRLVFRRINFESNLKQGAFGGGLLGLGFILFNYCFLQQTLFPTGVAWLGLASGFLMAMGIPTGLFYGREEMQMTTGQLDWKRTSKLAIAVVISTFIGQIGLITWVFWMGINLISK